MLRALRACFQFDLSVALDETRFQRLLPPLVTQLGADAPAYAQPALAISDPVPSCEVGTTAGIAKHLLAGAANILAGE